MLNSDKARLLGSLGLTVLVSLALTISPLVKTDPPLGASKLDLQKPEFKPIASTNANYTIQLASAQETRDLLWTGEVSLESRQDATAANATLAAEAIDCVILSPGETFSFNGTVGMRCQSKGYKPGLMYSDGDVVTGIGGGICIVSTLLYSASLETGLKILERHHHSGPVSYADPGRDAAVVYGAADLKFKNNTDKPLLIRAGVRENKLYVELFGTRNPDRKVQLAAKDYSEIPYTIVQKEDPSVPNGEIKVEQPARPGYSVIIVRKIFEKGRVVSEVVSQDTILPQDKILLVPVGTLRVTVTGGLGPLPTLPALPSEDLTKQQPTNKAQRPAPKSGTITIEEEATPVQEAPLSEPLPGETPGRFEAPASEPDLDLPASERTLSNAAE